MSVVQKTSNLSTPVDTEAIAFHSNLAKSKAVFYQKEATKFLSNNTAIYKLFGQGQGIVSNTQTIQFFSANDNLSKYNHDRNEHN